MKAQPPSGQPPAPAPARSDRRWHRLAGFAIALLLLGLAMWVIWHQRELVAEALRQLGDAPLWAIAALLALPIIAWITTAGSLWLLTLRFGRVGAGEMLALIGSASLLNYLPMRAGLIGRVAYHRRFNGIRVRDSARVLVEGLVLTALSAGVLLLLSLLMRRIGSTPTGVALVLAPGVLALLGALVTPASRRSTRLVLAAGALRYADMLTWVVRYLIVFHILGSPLSLAQGVLVASASQLALLVPIAGAGLGVREWAVGLTARTAAGGLGAALAADLLNRAAELIVTVPIGLVCTAWVARRVAKMNRQSIEVDPTSLEPGA